MFVHEAAGDELAAETLLQRIKAGRAALPIAETRASLDIAADEEFAVEHRGHGEGVRNIRKGCGDLLAATRIYPRESAGVHELDANAVPFPLGDIAGKVPYHRLKAGAFERMRQHERPKP
jgi:hypothetical protein